MTGIELHQKKQGLLKDQVRLTKRKDCDRYEIVPIQQTYTFEKGFFLFIRACQLLAQNNDGIILVGLAGPSGAGKTVFTEKLLNFMPSVAVISMDNYNDSSRIVDGNFDDPRLTDYDTLLKNVQDLKAGKSVEVPIYDFKSSSRIGYRMLEVPTSRIVIIEGIYALSERLRPLLDLRVSVTGGVHFDLVKRVLRDIQRAGQEPEEIIQQISETVYPMYKAFIEPDLQTAHIKIVNKFNPFSGFQSPTYILKSARKLMPDQIRAVLSEDHTETKEQIYDIYLLPPGEDPESCQSYLRMRNKDGKYNLMFEEWVTDVPFVISPRITFEVSVRLLGGLMALGYTIATILKRSSHIFFNDRVCVKIDWLEQVNRQYIQLSRELYYMIRAVEYSCKLQWSIINTSEVKMQYGNEREFYFYTSLQCTGLVLLAANHILSVQMTSQVQGRDRMVVRCVAEQLGLEGSYVPRTYIEQIQLERLVNDVMALPDDLKTSLKLDEELAATSSPKEALLRASADRVAMRNKNLKSGSMSHSYSTQRDKDLSKLAGLANNRLYEDRSSDSPQVQTNQGIITQLSEQISSLNDRMDEFTTRIEELNSKLNNNSNSLSRQNLALQAEACNGSGPTSYFISGLSNGSLTGSKMPNSLSSSQLAKESTLMEEISGIARGQRQVMHQLDTLSNLLRASLGERSQQVRTNRRSILADFEVPKVALILSVGIVGFSMLRRIS